MLSVDNKSDLSNEEIYKDSKLNFLLNPASYPELTSTVGLVSTHMSWVFLTDTFVYKLKKPFHYDHMRLLTPEARHQNCLEEVRLNRRLAEDVYLGVVPLSKNGEDQFLLGEGQKIIDWLVKMKRLPEEMMLGNWIKADQKVPVEKLEPAAKLLTRFYLSAEPIFMSGSGYLQKLRTALGKYRDEMLAPELELAPHIIDSIYQRQIEFMVRNQPVLENRARHHRIVEAHGDLKPEHICLSPTVIIDCLEFDQELRIMDILDDLSFLSLECDRMGAPWIGNYFVRHYILNADDQPAGGLINFYKSCKAFTRALLSIQHIREPQYEHDPKWRARTNVYLEMAANYIAKYDQ